MRDNSSRSLKSSTEMFTSFAESNELVNGIWKAGLPWIRGRGVDKKSHRRVRIREGSIVAIPT